MAGNGNLRSPIGDGGPAHQRAGSTRRHGVAVDAAGNLVIADAFNNRIRVVAASTGTFYGQAMTSGRHLHRRRQRHRRVRAATAARPPAPNCTSPAGVTVDSAGNLVVGRR